MIWSSQATPLEALLFDLDGVVIHSEPLHEKAIRLVLQQHDVGLPTGYLAPFIGRTDQVFFQHVCKEYDLDVPIPVLQERKEEAFETLIETEMMLVEGMASFITQVNECAVQMALVTSSGAKMTQRVLTHFNLHHVFDVVVTKEDVTSPKPDPAPYVLAALQLGVHPRACLVIEDSVNGVLSGKAAGCQVVGLTTTFSHTDLQKAGADDVVSSVATLAQRLIKEKRVW